ncbi:hypothetical protein GCM10020255_030790 [Rhodococcus baikonurensis]
MKFQSKSFARISIAALCAATIGSAVAAPVASAQAPSASQATGTVVSSEPLPKDLWIPGTADAKRFTYWTIGSNGGPALSSGAYYVPAAPLRKAVGPSSRGRTAPPDSTIPVPLRWWVPACPNVTTRTWDAGSQRATPLSPPTTSDWERQG